MIGLSIASLLISNFIPLLGVIYWGWDLSGILFLYWFENITIGFYTFIKILKLPQPDKKGFFAFFFLAHYGMFTFVHGVFLLFLIIGDLHLDVSLLLGVSFPFISHGISYLNNYIGKKEYEKQNAATLMFSPYGRVIAMHLTVLLGSFALMAAGTSLWPLIVLVLVKTIVDLLSHIIQHYGYVTFTHHPKQARS